MTTIAVIAMGEMGSGIARRLVERGATVLTSLAGRSAASAERAAAAGAEAVDDEALIARSHLFLSVVPPHSAQETAERFMPIIERAAEKPVFVDCNAIAPQTLHALSRPFLDRGLPFLDASIIGAAPKPDGSGPRLYISGAVGGEAEILEGLGLDARVLSESLGDASALKMSYAGITKGFQALGTAMALGAARNGALDSLVAELKDSQAGLYDWLRRQLPRMYPKAYRWDGEMHEIARFLMPEEGSSAMLNGAADLYNHVAEDNRAGPQSQIISTLNRFVGRES